MTWTSTLVLNKWNVRKPKTDCQNQNFVYLRNLSKVDNQILPENPCVPWFSCEEKIQGGGPRAGKVNFLLSWWMAESREQLAAFAFENRADSLRYIHLIIPAIQLAFPSGRCSLTFEFFLLSHTLSLSSSLFLFLFLFNALLFTPVIEHSRDSILCTTFCK